MNIGHTITVIRAQSTARVSLVTEEGKHEVVITGSVDQCEAAMKLVKNVFEPAQQKFVTPRSSPSPKRSPSPVRKRARAQAVGLPIGLPSLNPVPGETPIFPSMDSEYYNLPKPVTHDLLPAKVHHSPRRVGEPIALPEPDPKYAKCPWR